MAVLGRKMDKHSAGDAKGGFVNVELPELEIATALGRVAAQRSAPGQMAQKIQSPEIGTGEVA